MLARALLADAPVLVLDEPTAHLDGPAAERLVQDVLAAARDRAVLLITHRPEGLERVDEIVRLDPASNTVLLGRSASVPAYAGRASAAGDFTLPAPTGHSDEICPVCYWQDPFVDNQSGELLEPNDVTLAVARENFVRLGAHEEALGGTRPAADGR